MSRHALSITAVLAIAASVFVAGAATADTEMFPHPANVHAGSCLEVDDVVAPLGDASSQLLVDGTPTVTELAEPPEFAIPVEASVTTIPIAYADLLAAPHSIVVRQSADEPTVSLLCGDIGGAGMGPADLAFGLGPVDDSGYTGIATLHDNADGTTRVSLYVVWWEHLGSTAPAGPEGSIAA